MLGFCDFINPTEPYEKRSNIDSDGYVYRDDEIVITVIEENKYKMLTQIKYIVLKYYGS